MATFIIVSSGKKSLGANEIRAGDSIEVNNGDVFIFSASANDDVKFESAIGRPANFEIRFQTSNSNDFKVEIMEDLDAGIVISNGAKLADIDIDAEKALSVIMTAGDDVSLGKFQGSEDGVDLITIGNDFSTDQDITLNGGDNFLTIGNNANIRKIDSDDGADTITIGDGLSADDIKVGDGENAITIGDGAIVGKIETGKGEDTITIGDNFQQVAGSEADPNDIKTGEGDDVITIGDGADIKKIDTGKGDDAVVIGNDLTIDEIKTDEGQDAITIGDRADIDKIETGKGDDTVVIGNDLTIDDIKTDEGQDAITIGDRAVVDDLDTGKGDDTVSVGDFFTADKLETKEGDDTVIVGSGASIEDLDGGDDDDTLRSETDFPNAQNFETICFARRTLIETENGNAPIETLRVGDRVRTLDHGMQCIRWISSTRVPGRGLHAPVRIAAGALGNARTLWVSQQHRMFLSGWKMELHFGQSEVLVPAKHLVDHAGIDIVEVPSVEYFHILFDRHEIVFAEGIESESFHPGDVGLSTLSQEACVEIYSLFPSLLADSGSLREAARLSLKSFEAAILAA